MQRISVIKRLGMAGLAIAVISLLAACGTVDMAVGTFFGVTGLPKPEKTATALPEAFAKPSETFDDPLVPTSWIRQELSKRYKVFQVAIGPGPDWEVKRDDDNIILRKDSKRYIVFTYQDPENGAYYYNSCWIKRPYEGGGVYGNPILMFDLNPVRVEKSLVEK